MADPVGKVNVVTVALVLLAVSIQSAVVWLAASIYYAPAPQLAVFDADKSVERFVVWSSARVDDTQFDSVLARFGSDVERQLALWSQATGVAVVRSGAVIARGDTELVDWTDVVVHEVLQ